MSDSKQPTVAQHEVPTVVAVGVSAELLDYLRYAAAAAGARRVEPCEIPEASTVVARARPFAIVITADVYAFDRSEFDALAKDVRARVVSVPDGLQIEDAVRFLIDALDDAHRYHRGESN